MMSSTRMPQLLVRSSISRVGDAHLPLGGARLALLVDGQRDDGGAVLLDDRHDPGEPRPGPVAVLVVDRVDDRAAAEQLEAGLDHRRLGRVEHQRQRRRGGEPAGDLAHVRDAVAADVVDADVEQVRAVAGLVAGDLDAVVPALGEHRLAERLASRWRWCARRSTGTTCPAGTARAGRATRRPASGRGRRVARPRGRRTRSTTWRRCSGVVPQQPPTRASPNSRGERVVRVGELARASAGSARRRVPSSGRPALGMQDSADRGRAGTGGAGARSSRPGRWRS